jgi:hypothetical protein
MRKSLFSVVFILVFMLSACGNLTYKQNLNEWQNQSITHYRFTVVVTCFCPFAGAEVTYEVIDGVSALDSIYMPENREPDVELIKDMYAKYTTVEAVFSYLEQAIGTADEVRVEYDPTYAYPARISIDWIRLAVDDEQSLAITYFEPLP